MGKLSLSILHGASAWLLHCLHSMVQVQSLGGMGSDQSFIQHLNAITFAGDRAEGGSK